MDSSRFRQKYGLEADYWGQDDEHSVSDWQAEISDNETRLGYWDWVEAQREQAQEAEE